MKFITLVILLLSGTPLFAQPGTYQDSIKKYQQQYVDTHEVVKDGDRKFIHFFPVDQRYRVTASFEKISDTIGSGMKTSGKVSKEFFRYGTIHFRIKGKQLQLTVFQSKQLLADSVYKNYLFIPFTDLTSGEQSYGGGKYIDIMIEDIKGNALILDFNKAYNPYCAYTTGYNCPIPPVENDLPVAILAGEKEYGKAH